MGRTLAAKIAERCGATAAGDAAPHLARLVAVPLVGPAAAVLGPASAGSGEPAPDDVVLCVARDFGSMNALHVEVERPAIPPEEKEARGAAWETDAAAPCGGGGWPSPAEPLRAPRPAQELLQEALRSLARERTPPVLEFGEGQSVGGVRFAVRDICEGAAHVYFSDGAAAARLRSAEFCAALCELVGAGRAAALVAAPVTPTAVLACCSGNPLACMALGEQAAEMAERVPEEQAGLVLSRRPLRLDAASAEAVDAALRRRGAARAAGGAKAAPPGEEEGPVAAVGWELYERFGNPAGAGGECDMERVRAMGDEGEVPRYPVPATVGEAEALEAGFMRVLRVRPVTAEEFEAAEKAEAEAKAKAAEAEAAAEAQKSGEGAPQEASEK